MASKYDVRRDRILFLDVEMTCWDGTPPEGETPEIIEFGLAEVDVPTLAITRSASLYVRPTRSRVSPFCTELTGITPDLVRREGRPLQEVAAHLRKNWGVGSKAWMSWGSDKRAVDRDFQRAELVSPFSAHFTDLGFLFGALHGANAGVGLSMALQSMGVERSGRAHSGSDDAASLASLWIEAAKRLRSAAVEPSIEIESFSL